jgi:fructose/tagatose bisphosphate aldolase
MNRIHHWICSSKRWKRTLVNEVHDDLRKAIGAGIDIVHINTELRVACRRGPEHGLAKYPDEVVPYKSLPSVVEFVKAVVGSRLKLFSVKGTLLKRHHDSNSV